MANEDTLLPTQMFPCLSARATFAADTNLCPGHKKCFWFCSETVCVRNKCFPVCAAQETSWATICPQQCVLVCQGIYNLFAKMIKLILAARNILPAYTLMSFKRILKIVQLIDHRARATLNFRKLKLVINSTSRFSLNFAKRCVSLCSSNVHNIKRFHRAVFEL